MAAIAPPRNSDPVSPMKTLAGLKLYSRKPSRPPARPEANTPRERYVSPHSIVTATKNTHTGKLVPVARPSTPSVRFTALTVPTMTNAAKITYTGSGIGNDTFQNGI